MCELFAMSALQPTTVSLSLKVFLVASVPLTAEGWIALGEGEIVVARRGRIETEKG